MKVPRPALLSAFALLVTACGDNSGSQPANGSGSATPAPEAGPPPSPTDPKDHEATPEGLKAQLSALIAAKKSGDEAQLKAHTEALALPDAQTWFRDRFGASTGRKMYVAYKPIGDNLDQVASLITGLDADGHTELDIGKYEKVDDLDAVTYQARALKQMLIADPLYSVRMRSKEKTFHVWSFVHAGGRFRYVGKMREVAEPDTFGKLDLNEFRPTDAEKLRNAPKSP